MQDDAIHKAYTAKKYAAEQGYVDIAINIGEDLTDLINRKVKKRFIELICANAITPAHLEALKSHKTKYDYSDVEFFYDLTHITISDKKEQEQKERKFVLNYLKNKPVYNDYGSLMHDKIRKLEYKIMLYDFVKRLSEYSYDEVVDLYDPEEIKKNRYFRSTIERFNNLLALAI